MSPDSHMKIYNMPYTTSPSLTHKVDIATKLNEIASNYFLPIENSILRWSITNVYFAFNIVGRYKSKLDLKVLALLVHFHRTNVR